MAFERSAKTREQNRLSMWLAALVVGVLILVVLVTCLAAAELAFDSIRPELVTVLNVQEDSAVGSFSHPSPLYMKIIVAILFSRTHISERIAGYMDLSILHLEHIQS